ncbi:MAG: beta-ketoacyl synthase chain length factor [Syntrophaceae bacterium]
MKQGPPAYYINAAGVISPQKTYCDRVFLTEISEYAGNKLTCVLPDFKEFMNPFQMRRLSRMLKTGLAAVMICLRNSGVKVPDAVITATGFGFYDSRAKFLAEILKQAEQQLTPNYFIQSTHNALAGLVALTIGCTGYNNTYAGRGSAFESALLDAMMLLDENESEAQNILVGSFDEVSEVLFRQYARLGYFRKEPVNNLRLFDEDSPGAGAIQGEGVAFFMLSSAPKKRTLCRLRGMKMLYKPEGYGDLAAALETFLKENDLDPRDIDVFINGASGDAARDKWNSDLQHDFLEHAAEVRFKHLTGEYATASSFALWLGAMILKKKHIPEVVLARPARRPERKETALVCNHFLSRYYTFMILDSVTP